MWLLIKRLRRHHRLLASLLLVMTVSGCGFELRGQGDSISALGRYPLAVMSAAPNGEFAAELRALAQQRGANLMSPSDAVLVLTVDNAYFEQRNLSLTARARAAEIELRASVNFSLRLKDTWLIENETLAVAEQLLNDPLNVVGKTEELRLLQSELRVTLATSLIRRVDYRVAAYHADKT